jgi:hypothetical protein
LKEKEDSDGFEREEFIIKPVGYVRSELKTPSLKARGDDARYDFGSRTTCRNLDTFSQDDV